LNEKIKSKVVNVKRENYKTMTVKLVFEEKVLSVISAGAPQVGCKESEKEYKGLMTKDG